MDAQELFREGVVAIREKNDSALANRLLSQSLKLDPKNIHAWLWLSRTVADADKQLEYVEHALAINPHHAQALQLRDHLLLKIQPKIIKTSDSSLTLTEKSQVETALQKAEDFLVFDDIESALTEWKTVLNIQIDHEYALSQAVKHLWEYKRYDEARRLVWRALKAETTSPLVYKTALDIAERQKKADEIDDIRARMASLPSFSEMQATETFERFMRERKHFKALETLEYAVKVHPTNQHLWMNLADLKTFLGRGDMAQVDYEQVVKIDPRSKYGKEAEKRLHHYVPQLSEQERQNIWLAIREAAAFGLFFWLLAIQDAGLKAINIGVLRWLGIILSFIGGYLLISATSSPSQAFLLKYFTTHSDKTPPNQQGILSDTSRQIIGTVAGVILIVAFGLVFSRSIGLLLDPVEPDLSELERLIFEEE
jgi:tetratricopeptide (TPR) repeat protein